MSKMSIDGSGEGNTIPPPPSAGSASKRISVSKSWVFTHNNYEESNLSRMSTIFNQFGLKYIIGKEVGDQGTKHLQGWVCDPKKGFRPMEKFNKCFDFKPHWEKARGNMESNLLYCSKDGDYVTNCEMPEIEAEIEIEQPYGWQLDVLKVIETKPDKRSIHWFWGDGNVGKSDLMRYLVVKHNAIVCAGKAADMKHMIATSKKKPKIVVFDVPRCNFQYISYAGMEEIKNGVFASTKYESCMVTMNHPHLIVFANSEPEYESMSKDRWKIHRINTLVSEEKKYNPSETFVW